MSLWLYAPLFCALALAAAAEPTARALAPKPGSIMLVLAALTVAIAADAALCVLVAARLLDAAPIATLLSWPPETSAPIPVPVPVSLLAGVLLIIAALVAAADWKRTCAARHWLEALHCNAPATELIVVSASMPLAHTLPRTRRHPGRILVSDTMLRSLRADERRVLLAHERSHLRHRHDRYGRLTRIVARINPLLRPVVAAIDYLLERWADEDAAETVGSRTLTARALTRAAVQHPDRTQPHPAGFATHRVTGRVNALLTPASQNAARLMLLLPTAIAITASLASLIDLHALAHLYHILRAPR